MCTKKGITHVKNNFYSLLIADAANSKEADSRQSDTDEYQRLYQTPLNTDAISSEAPLSETITTESKITGTMDWIEE